MKTILVINSEMHNDKHVCCIEDEIKCPLWNNDRYICQYCLNTNTKDCPLKPITDVIPVEYIKEWFKRDDDFWSPNILDYLNKLYDDWRKENE